MKTKFLAGLMAILMISVVSCKKKEDPETPLKIYRVTLDLRPTSGASAQMDNSKNVYLSLRDAKVYSVAEGKEKSDRIDLIMYDGNTTAGSIGNVHFLSPTGGTSSLLKGQSIYKYMNTKGGGDAESYFNTLGLDTWTIYNTTWITDEAGVNGVTLTDFNNMNNVDDFNKYESQVLEAGTNNSNVVKQLLNTSLDKLNSQLWYFECDLGDDEKLTAFGKIIEYNYNDGGHVIIEIRQKP